MLLICPAFIFAPVPPPVKYLTVKVVFEGAIPYEFVKIKLVGEKAVVNLSCSNGNPIPTLSELGITNSSTWFGCPAPNCICNEPEFKNLEANLLCTCFN